MILYNLCSTEEPHQYQITKFDSDFNVESTYTVSESGCDCPQAHKPTCRHRRMLPLFLATDRIDTNWFLKFEDSSWHQVGQAESPTNQSDSPMTLPDGVTIFGLDDPAELHQAIAEAVGEDVGAVPYLPKAPESPTKEYVGTYKNVPVFVDKTLAPPKINRRI